MKFSAGCCHMYSVFSENSVANQLKMEEMLLQEAMRECAFWIVVTIVMIYLLALVCWLFLGPDLETLGLDAKKEQIVEMEKNVEKVDSDSARTEEKPVQHEILRHVETFAEEYPKAESSMRLEATSCCVSDNGAVEVEIPPAVDLAVPGIDQNDAESVALTKENDVDDENLNPSVSCEISAAVLDVNVVPVVVGPLRVINSSSVPERKRILVKKARPPTPARKRPHQMMVDGEEPEAEPLGMNVIRARPKTLENRARDYLPREAKEIPIVYPR